MLRQIVLNLNLEKPFRNLKKLVHACVVINAKAKTLPGAGADWIKVIYPFNKLKIFSQFAQIFEMGPAAGAALDHYDH